jgi:hypothetical protein
MFEDLPKLLQEKVLEHLQENNFPAAKLLYDEYHRQQAEQLRHPLISPAQEPQPTTIEN